MKKVYISIAALSLCASMLMAQAPVNRTVKTTVADVLAQMPVAKQAEYNKLIKELSATGEEGVLMLANRINPPGQGNNSNVDYALSGLTHYVMTKGEENVRLVVANAYLKALDKVSERETKAFIIRQLQILGKDECVDALSAYLNDGSLSSPAACALVSIGTPKAGKALTTALKSRAGSPETQKNIIQAIGDIQMAKAEELLKTVLDAANPDIQIELLYALSQTGSLKSMNALANAAAKDGYTKKKTGANEAYITLLNRLVEQGYLKEAVKAAKKLQKDAAKAGQEHIREAALQILLHAERAKGKAGNASASQLILEAMKDSNRSYRNAALNNASRYADKDLYIELVKVVEKATPELKIDIMSWIGREAKNPSKHALIQNLEIRSGLPLQQVLLQQLVHTDFNVKQAATWTLVKIGNQSCIPSIAALLKNNDKQTVLLGQDALVAFPGNINGAVAEVVPSSTDAGKIAGIELLAMRKAATNLKTVLGQTQSASPEVKKAAYTALKDVVSGKDMDTMCAMLESADEQAVPAMQRAVISALSLLPAQEQVKTVITRMSQANDKDYLYYLILSATGQPEVLPTIVKGFHSNTGIKQNAAFEAILNWRDCKAVGELYDICKKNPSSAYFEPGLTTYVKLVSNPAFTGERRLLNLRKAMEIARTDNQKKAILQQIEKTGTLPGLLYAGEFLDEKPVQQDAANAVMNIALGNKEYTGANIRNLLNKVVEVLDNPDARYQIEAIKKHLDEMPKGEGFVPVFNGKDLAGWKGLVENPIIRAKMKPAQLAQAQKKADEAMNKGWKVENGVLAFKGADNGNLCTEKQYSDFEMYADWMVDPADTEADAGICLRGTPKVQIWNTASTNADAQGGSGGLLNNQANPSKPSKTADNQPGEWNSFYIKMAGDRVTVILNGEKVADDVILENCWDRKSPIFPMEQIELQAHGKIQFRNICIKELERKEPFKLSKEEEKEGFKVLFNGTNMHEWTGNTVDYTLEDNCISMNPSKSFGGNLYTKKEYGNFIFRFDFQLTPGANNGVGIRTPMEGDAAYVGMEIQILDCEHPIYKDITPLQHHGSVYGIIPTKANHHDAFKPIGEWNTEEIVADGDNIRVTVNGVVIMEGNIREAAKNGTADHHEHPGLFNSKGHIGFLGHGSPLKFRNIRIKELK